MDTENKKNNSENNNSINRKIASDVVEKINEYLSNKNNDLDSRYDIIEELKNTDFTLCLGAGVSSEINEALHGKKYLWNGLLYNIWGEYLKNFVARSKYSNSPKIKNIFLKPCEESDEKQNDFYDKFINDVLNDVVKKEKFLDSENSAECVEYLRYFAYGSIEPSVENYNYEDNIEIAENTTAILIHKLLYNNTDKLSEKNSITEKFEEMINNSYNCKDGRYDCSKNGKTIIETARLLQLLYKKRIEQKNCSLDVLTYNYDDFLEQALALQIPDSAPVESTSIYNIDTQNNSAVDGIKIFHVHGFIPFDWNYNEPKGDFIFSENSYNHISGEMYHWANVTQVGVYSSKRVLFVGFSGVDTNFRRLMKEINKSKKNESINNHIMFASYKKIVDELVESFVIYCNIYNIYTNIEKYSDLITPVIVSLTTQLMGAKRDYYKQELGIDIVWYYDTVEIPNMLHTLSQNLLETGCQCF